MEGILHHLLRAHTHASHQAVEKQLLVKIKLIRTLADYAAVLKMIYGFYAPLEQGIESYISSESSIELPQRRKASKALDDLCFIGDAGDVAICEEIPAIQSFHQALGVLYVLEGSTLGGTVLSRMIRNQIEIADSGLSFFLGYGEHTMVMWEKFKSHLAGPFSELEKAEVISSAEDTFITFKKWIEKHAANEL